MAKRKKRIKRRKKCATGILCTRCKRPAKPDPNRPEWDGKLILKGEGDNEEELCPDCFLGIDLLDDESPGRMLKATDQVLQSSGMDYVPPRKDPRLIETLKKERFTEAEKQHITEYCVEKKIQMTPEQRQRYMSTIPLTSARG